MVLLFRRRNIVRFLFGRGSLFIAMLWMTGIHSRPAPLAADEKNATPDKAGEGDGRDLSEEQALKRKAQMAAMERLAGSLKVAIKGAAPGEAALIPEALFRSHDPARENSPDGSIWGYGTRGRPVALLSLTLYPPRDGRPGGWLHELNSLSAHPVEAIVPSQPNWSSRKSGIELKDFPDAPAAADTEAGRTRQFRELSARFAGFELLQSAASAKPERFELRLIPRPIYRYSDRERGQLDGAIFLMTYSTNPEIVLVIELSRENEKPVWKYGFNRISFAELHVELGDKEIWTQPHTFRAGPEDPYWLFFKPAAAGELDP